MLLSLRREEFALKHWARSSPLGDKLPENELVQAISIYEAKRHVLDNKIPYAITGQEFHQRTQMENIEIETPTNYGTAYISSIQQWSKLMKIIKKGITSDKAANRLGNSYIERRYGSIFKIFTDGKKIHLSPTPEVQWW